MLEQKVLRYVTAWSGGDGTFDFGILGSPTRTILDAHKEIVEDFIEHHERYVESLRAELIEIVLADITEDTFSIDPKDYNCDYDCVYNIERVSIDV